MELSQGNQTVTRGILSQSPELVMQQVLTQGIQGTQSILLLLQVAVIHHLVLSGILLTDVEDVFIVCLLQQVLV